MAGLKPKAADSTTEQKFRGFHFYTFGAVNDTLEWACKTRSGSFSLSEDFGVQIEK